MPEDPHIKYFLQNIKITHEYLVNISKGKLFNKVDEIYLYYQLPTITV